MENKTFFNFIKWYFKFISDKFYETPSNTSLHYITKKERLGLVITAYLIFISSWFILFLEINAKYFLFSILIIIFIVLLCLTRFSFTYYFILYKKSKNINRSINDKVIIEECMLYKVSEKIRNVINQYYKIIDVRGTIFSLKYYLFDRTKKNNSNSRKKYDIIKIKSNKIYLNGKKISNKRLINTSELNNLFLVERNKEKTLKRIKSTKI